MQPHKTSALGIVLFSVIGPEQSDVTKFLIMPNNLFVHLTSEDPKLVAVQPPMYLTIVERGVPAHVEEVNA